jgi:hypothetical protein
VTPSASHLFALLRTGLASFGACLTVIHRVFGAFFAACLADLGAKLADLRREVTFAGHEASGKPAKRSAVHVQRNASGHRVRVGFLQA